MNKLINVIASVLLPIACLSEVNALVIDDFNTGNIIGLPISSTTKNYFSTGSMLGGTRYVRHIATQINPGLIRNGVVNVTDGHLILEDGVAVGSRVEIHYGLNDREDVVPLKLDLSRVLSKTKLNLHFHSIDMLNEIGVTIQLGTPSREIFQLSKNITSPVVGPFKEAFNLGEFRSNSSGNSPTANDLKSVDYITVIIQESGNGGSDYAIDMFDVCP